MTDDDLKHIFYDGAHNRLIDALRSVASAARSEGAEEERKAILHETGSTVVKACAALVRLSAPDDVDDAYVPRAAVVDIAMGLKRDMDALRSRSAAGKGE